MRASRPLDHQVPWQCGAPLEIRAAWGQTTSAQLVGGRADPEAQRLCLLRWGDTTALPIAPITPKQAAKQTTRRQEHKHTTNTQNTKSSRGAAAAGAAGLSTCLGRSREISREARAAPPPVQTTHCLKCAPLNRPRILLSDCLAPSCFNNAVGAKSEMCSVRAGLRFEAGWC